MDQLTVRVASKTAEVEGICSFRLVDAQGAPLPAFSAGAHIDVHLPNRMVRQYSLCNPATGADHYRIGVLRETASRGGSAFLHEQVQVGDTLRIGLPRNQFPLQPARKTLLFAGGIGITPMLCMAAQLARARADFVLHYCVRSPTRAAFLSQIRQSDFGDKVQLHYDSGPPLQRLDALRVLAQPAPDSHVYVCGPAGFIGYIGAAAQTRGWLPTQVHHESFGSPLADLADGAAGADNTFDIQIASSGQRYTVPPGRSALQVLLDQGIDIAASCERGLCGACATPVLEGIPDHRDSHFSDREHARNDCFTPCVSRAKSAVLLLDL